MLRMVDAPNERGRTHHHHYSYFAVVGISIFDTRIVSPLTSPVRFEVVPKNMPLLLAGFSGTCWMTSQCSMILPSLRRKKSINAPPGFFGLSGSKSTCEWGCDEIALRDHSLDL